MFTLAKPLAASAAAVALALASVAAPAQAATPGGHPAGPPVSFYNDKSPDLQIKGATGLYRCSDSRSTIDHRDTPFGTLYLFRSKRCHTYWTTFVVNATYAGRVGVDRSCQYQLAADVITADVDYRYRDDLAPIRRRPLTLHSGRVFQTKMADGLKTGYQVVKARSVIRHVASGTTMSVQKTGPFELW
ncbi:hypothetical protein [Nakamurella aerolata]|uniref:DUF2690 domain-containing protein n=1 Tax=Nakamurella aerolata TaxID=1656892 RepID=A0A849A6P3_9ACTN|nr:hypothetical protein [Nakamurella aerolata]NNG34778.1 hypothetical protein [Nakamurella aerolata]